MEEDIIKIYDKLEGIAKEKFEHYYGIVNIWNDGDYEVRFVETIGANNKGQPWEKRIVKYRHFEGKIKYDEIKKSKVLDVRYEC